MGSAPGTLAMFPYSLVLFAMLLGPTCRKRTSVSGSSTGSGRSSNPLVALKSAVLAPIPSASESTTIALHVFPCSSTRTA